MTTRASAPVLVNISLVFIQNTETLLALPLDALRPQMVTDLQNAHQAEPCQAYAHESSTDTG